MYNWGSSQPLLHDTAKLGDLLGDERTASDRAPGSEVLVQRWAMGVIFSIAPWNRPVALALHAMAIPILESAEPVHCPELFQEAGLPTGVLNLVSVSKLKEDSAALTAEIIVHPFVRKINFTGSDRVGRIITSEAAKFLKPCVFELGGKAPAMVLDDADIDAAAKGIISGALVLNYDL
ncbi:Aldehyde/histidinol dehydrogenase [Armillaria nabsnona]|nr:Aldehyde/histidinol dehydrogenase [Armillaria nabsnona]